MAYKTGLRLMAALCFLASFTVILAPITIPLGILFWRKARKEEKEIEEMREAIAES